MLTRPRRLAIWLGAGVIIVVGAPIAYATDGGATSRIPANVPGDVPAQAPANVATNSPTNGPASVPADVAAIGSASVPASGGHLARPAIGGLLDVPFPTVGYLQARNGDVVTVLYRDTAISRVAVGAETARAGSAGEVAPGYRGRGPGI